MTPEKLEELEKLDDATQEAEMTNNVVKSKIIGDLEWQDEIVPKMSWDKALEYAKSLREGWRLPTVQELVSLWDYDKGCCPEFPDASDWYWSSSPFVSYYACYVIFNYGYVSDDARYYEFGVRCVRSTKR
jgi:hypothetical protein